MVYKKMKSTVIIKPKPFTKLLSDAHNGVAYPFNVVELSHIETLNSPVIPNSLMVFVVIKSDVSKLKTLASSTASFGCVSGLEALLSPNSSMLQVVVLKP